MFGLNFSEVFVVGLVAILLFGKRLPEVAKSLGYHYRELRKGLSEFHSVLDSTDSHVTRPKTKSTSTYRSYDDYEPVTAPRFEPPTSEPRNTDSQTSPSQTAGNIESQVPSSASNASGS